MERCLFASDLHGRPDGYEKLFAAVERERPDAVFLGGDLLPGGWEHGAGGAGPPFFEALRQRLEGLRAALGGGYPRILAIPGNDDPGTALLDLAALEAEGLLESVHGRAVRLGERTVLGYACVPPSPFLLKDFERYDVSRYVDPGCVSPEEGLRTVPADESDVRYGTIAADLEALAAGVGPGAAILLCHAPPYGSLLDRAALDGVVHDGVPADVHVGSIAVRRFIEARRPAVGLHGHVHESARLTGAWRDDVGGTPVLSAAHDGPELALVRFDLASPAGATRALL